MIKFATDLSKVNKTVLEYANSYVNRVTEYQESQGYSCLDSDIFLRAILQTDDVGESKHLYFYVYLKKQFESEENEKILDLSEVLIQEVYLHSDNNFDLFEHGYTTSLSEDELTKSVWRSSLTETPLWVQVMERN